MRYHHGLSLGVSAIALIAAAPSAFAQDRASTADPAATDAPQEAGTEIVVTGRRAALESADRRKEKSETIIDSVVADDAGKLPDNSITEVLQRVAGVSIVRFAALGDPDHFSVEGSGVQVRGLSGVASRLNGREIFGANSGRALLWGDVTPELMAAVDVYKASTADLIEGGTGGQIDLRTKMPFDYKGFAVAGTGQLSMGDLAQKADGSGSVLVTDRWKTGIGDIGVLVDVAYSSLSTHSDFFRMEPYQRTAINGTDYFIPAGYDYGNEDFNRKRTGIYAALQWAPTSDLEFRGTFFQSRYKNRSRSHGGFVVSQDLAVNPADSTFDNNNGLTSSSNIFVRNEGTGLPSGTITSGGNSGIATSNTVTRDYSLGMEWTPGGGPLAVRGAFQYVDSRARVNNYDIFRDVTYPGTFGLDLRGDLPAVSLPANAQASFNNPASYNWSADQPHAEDNHGKQYAGNLDLEYSFDDDSFFRSIKAGARYADRSERDLSNGYNWSAFGRSWNGDPQLTYANAAPGDVQQYAFDDFFHGGVTPPGFTYFASQNLVQQVIDSAAARNALHAKPQGVTCNSSGNNCVGQTTTGYGGRPIRTPGFILPDDLTNYKTTNLAGYALIRFGREASDGGIGFNGNVGGRVVRIENSSSGNFTQSATTFVRNGVTYALATRADVLSGGATFTRFLPSVNLQILPTPKTHVRFGYNITTDNQSFYALRAQGSLGVTTVTPQGAPSGTTPNFINFNANTGNPLLKPTRSNNFDLSFEWYPKGGTTIHVAAFYKKIQDLPIYKSSILPVTVYYTQPTVTSTVEQAQVIGASTADESATVKGIEIGGRAFLDMLPGFLRGFGVEANYTYIDSSNPGDQYVDINAVTRNDLPLQGLSRHTFNATLLYEKDPISARIAYSWRSKYLQTTTGNGTSGQYNYYSRPGAAAQVVDISLPIYGAAYGTLDAGVRFRVNNHFSFSIEGTNLLNATAKTIMGGYPNDAEYIRSWFQSDRRISTSISLAF